MRSDSPDTLVWLPVSNAAGETIPAFAAMRVTGVDSDGIFTVAKPNADSAVTNIMFNGPVEIESGLYGHGTFGIPCSARYDTADGTPSNGDEWGVESGGWKLRNAKLGFKIQGSTDSSNGVATVVRNLDAAAAGGGLDLSGRTGSIADVTALQILRGVISGTAGAAVFTPDEASASLPGIVSTGTQTIAGAKNLSGVLTTDTQVIVNNTQQNVVSLKVYANSLIGLIASEFGLGLRVYENDDLTGDYGDFQGYTYGARIMLNSTYTPVTFANADPTYGNATIFQGNIVADGINVGVTGTGGGGDSFSKGICYSLGSGPTITNLTYSGSHAATGDISPAQLTANTNDWAPTGWS